MFLIYEESIWLVKKLYNLVSDLVGQLIDLPMAIHQCLGAFEEDLAFLETWNVPMFSQKNYYFLQLFPTAY